MFSLSPRFLAMAREACHKTAYTGREWGFVVQVRGKTLHAVGRLVKGSSANIMPPSNVDGFFHTHPSGICQPSDGDIETCMEVSIGLILVGTASRDVGVFNVPYGEALFRTRV